MQSRESFFSTDNHIWAVKGDMRDEKNERDTANGMKSQGIVSDQCAFQKRLLLRAKQTDAWTSVMRTTFTGTMLAATEFNDFYVLVNTLSALTTVLSSHTTMRYVTRSPTSQNKLSTLPANMANP